ncbi:unnamed protein product [Durusdinium trenchii]|uniref:Uncharacterized protein n=1 Tax=Durusdinium trenchii TaxID=1381693 RepID=A0ABP0S619_9DINO
MASTTGELRLATTATVATAAPEAAPLPAAQPGEPEPLAAEPPRVQRPRVLRQRGEQLRQSCEGCAKGWREALDFEKKFLLRHFDGEPGLPSAAARGLRGAPLPEPEKEEPAEVPAPAPEGAADDTAGRALTTVTDAGPDAAPNDADEKLSETAKEPPKEPPKVRGLQSRRRAVLQKQGLWLEDVAKPDPEQFWDEQVARYRWDHRLRKHAYVQVKEQAAEVAANTFTAAILEAARPLTQSEPA